MLSFKTFYNTTKDHIILREYGRTVQQMCDHLLKIEDKTERTKTAHTIIEVMRQVNPTIPSNAPKDLDMENKLWDDLHIICNFELDIDAPFPAPEPDIMGKKPIPLKYKRTKIRLRHYGQNLESLVNEAKQKPEGEEQYQAFAFILRLMKTYYSDWNVDNAQDGNFVEDIETLANMHFSDEMRERLLIEGGIIDPNALLRMKQRQEKQNLQNKKNHPKNNLRNNYQNNNRPNNNNRPKTNSNNTNNTANQTKDNTNQNRNNRNNKFRNHKNKPKP